MISHRSAVALTVVYGESFSRLRSQVLRNGSLCQESSDQQCVCHYISRSATAPVNLAKL